MTKQIKATILDIESKLDKNNHPYYRLSLQGMLATYFYVFSDSVQENIFQLLHTPHNLVNRQVLISYEETRSSKRTSVVGDQVPNKNGAGVFYKVKDLQII
jgi:hypothetical protein